MTKNDRSAFFNNVKSTLGFQKKWTGFDWIGFFTAHVVSVGK